MRRSRRTGTDDERWTSSDELLGKSLAKQNDRREGRSLRQAPAPGSGVAIANISRLVGHSGAALAEMGYRFQIRPVEKTESPHHTGSAAAATAMQRYSVVGW
jgi:hypothetical protein